MKKLREGKDILYLDCGTPAIYLGRVNGKQYKWCTLESYPQHLYTDKLPESIKYHAAKKVNALEFPLSIGDTIFFESMNGLILARIININANTFDVIAIASGKEGRISKGLCFSYEKILGSMRERARIIEILQGSQDTDISPTREYPACVYL